MQAVFSLPCFVCGVFGSAVRALRVSGALAAWTRSGTRRRFLKLMRAAANGSLADTRQPMRKAKAFRLSKAKWISFTPLFWDWGNEV
uniref:Putative secreted protein n=1 Tax=Ixodes ricinus TaxID=34613 RepID=A0A6B0TZI1_IXORI